VILLEAGDGTGGTEAYGPPIIDPLANHTTTCTYDRPGTGTSDPAPGRRRTLASYRTIWAPSCRLRISGRRTYWWASQAAGTSSSPMRRHTPTSSPVSCS
jgi:hypothetical protein